MILDNLVSRAGLTESGRDFLIAALDPMHDTQLHELQGWPDVETASSVVRCVKQTVTIASNQAPGVNWDCHIVQWPYMDLLNMTQYTRNGLGVGNRILSNGAGAYNVGGLQAYGVVAGANLDVTHAGTVLASLNVDTSYSEGSGRLVGIGFEVINTTSQLNVQGQTTVYRQPQSHPRPVCYVTQNLATAFDPVFSGHMIRSPPLSQPHAMLIPGSRQWLAKDGCYVVQTFVGQDNPPCIVDYLEPIVQLTDVVEDAIGGPTTNTSSVLAPATSAVGTYNLTNVATKIYPIHMSGAIFTGLSSTTTLSLTLNYFYETFPSPAEQSILVLATPSACYDPIALEIFSHVLSQMPVGVPSYENDEGGWFNSLCEIIAKVAPVVTPILAGFNPALGMLSTGIGAAATSYLAQPSPQSKPKMIKQRPNNKPMNSKPRIQNSRPQPKAVGQTAKKKKKKIATKKADDRRLYEAIKGLNLG